MTQRELKMVEQVTNDYYIQNWDRIIMKLMRFANPQIANFEALESLKIDPTEKIYFYTAWLKPGQNTYVIQRFAVGNSKDSFQI